MHNFSKIYPLSTPVMPGEDSVNPDHLASDDDQDPHFVHTHADIHIQNEISVHQWIGWKVNQAAR